ncbi:hypothetical protein [Phenylobacterium sp.]|uniref:TolB family protein n=1 Tax=Phenylobacterium sp. TaxID=1871053 RepID=UPI0025EEFFF1|nr:hypothetical protein [Phenylobacterium sp.]
MKTFARTASRLALAVGLAAALPAAAHAEDAKEAPKWDVAAPPGMKVREVPIAVEEGTWMNLDVSPDGRTLVFDLLGDIYTLPISGGAPTRISEGLPYETQPRFSPDGRRIAFTSDRGGGDNIWIMNRDGSDKRQLTQESFRLMNQPSWSPDGQYIVAKKHFTPSARSARARSGCTTSPAGTGFCWSSAPANSTRRNWASRSSPPMVATSISRGTPRRARSSSTPRTAIPSSSPSTATTFRPARPSA